jgi:CheY-like chemotaxis protein
MREGPLLELFRADVASRGARIEENLAALEGEADPAARLAAIARDARAVAGAACILGIDPAMRLARAIEDKAGAGARRVLVIGAAAIEAMLRATALLARIAAASAHLEGWMIDNAEVVEAVLATMAKATEAPPPVTTRKRVLVVDDSGTVREVERRMLARRGYEVDVAADGVEAWAALEAARYDLVVTDIDMPRMSGLELTSRIKADARTTTIPVVIVTNRAGDIDRAQGLAAGATRYLAKGSYGDEAVADAVRDLIGAP